MASTLLINPRQALRALEKAGIPKDQANEIVKIFEDIDISHLTTKQDLQTSIQKLSAYSDRNIHFVERKIWRTEKCS